ncbi:MAG: putative zinc-binding metallopeptidase [Acidimicrobiia bacterium]|nr:putative zinc-binding metallopeptidase [Acidimicrobiia bacterium]
MRAFNCPSCGQLVPFEAESCLRCGSELGFSPEQRAIVTVSNVRDEAPFRCANHILAGCNWLAADDSELCASCRLTRTRPHDADLGSGPIADAFVAAEAAKRRLLFQLLELGLPGVSATRAVNGGPVFDLLTEVGEPVTTGHLEGVITVDLAESDDVHRERMRREFGEPYRTVLGHLRHEIGHYYWSLLVDADVINDYRSLFGDERTDYREALDRHYELGPPAGWVDCYVSAYAAAHPWEDWAETFAHYLHIRDTLQTAAAFGILVTGSSLDPALMAAPTADRQHQFEDIIADWLPLTYALNAVNRSMGKDDLYPFVLAPAAVDKLAFVHGRVDR